MSDMADALKIPKDVNGLVWFMLDVIDGLRHRAGRVPVEEQHHMWSLIRQRVLELNIDPGAYEVFYHYDDTAP
jgi:hypothetical protein